MTIDRFHQLVRILANQAWVRYYLHMLPGKMVLEVALHKDAANCEQLNKDFASMGFTALETPQLIPEMRFFRWAVDRTDSD